MPADKAEITFPKADSDKLILVASFNLAPSAWVFDYFSEPARSTKFNLPVLNDSSLPTYS